MLIGFGLFLITGIGSTQVLTRWQSTVNRLDYTDVVQHPSGALFFTPRGATGNGFVSRIDPNTGATMWATNLLTQGGLPVLAPAPQGVLVGNGFAFGNSVKIFLVDTTGTILQASFKNVDANVEKIVYTSGKAVVSGGRRTGTSSYDFWVMAVDLTTGQTLWTYQEAGSGMYGARQLAVLPSGDVVTAGVANNSDLVVVRLTPDSGQVVWRTVVSPGTWPSNLYNVPGMAVLPGGKVLVTASVGNQALVALLDSTGTVGWSSLSTGTARGLALKDTLLYALRSNGGNVLVARRDIPTGTLLWEKSVPMDLTVNDAGVDSAGNLLAGGYLPYPQGEALLSFTKDGVLRYAGPLFGGTRISGLTWIGTDVMVAGDAGHATAGRYAILPYLSPLALVWDDGNDSVPNTEGDPLAGDSLRLAYRMLAHGDTMQPQLLLRCVGCGVLTLPDSLQMLPLLVEGDTLTVSFPAMLAPGGAPLHLQLLQILGTDTLLAADSTLQVVPESTLTELYTVLDEADVHHPERRLYSWVETTSTSALPAGDTAIHLPLPAPFVYAGVAYDSVWVGTNGWLMFGDTLAGFGATLPDPGLPLSHGLVFVARQSGLNATLDTVQAGSLWTIIWDGVGARAELTLDYGRSTRSDDDLLQIQYETLTDTTVSVGLQFPYNNAYTGRMLWDGATSSPSFPPPAPHRVYTLLPLLSPFQAPVPQGATWTDSNDNQPGSWGDTAQVSFAWRNRSRSTGPVQFVMACEETGNGLCSAVHISQPTDTLQTYPFVPKFHTVTPTLSLILDSTGQAGETLTLRTVIATPIREDTFRTQFVLVQDTQIIPIPESVMVGMGYVGLESGDSTDLSIPSLSWVELNPDSGGTGSLLSVDDWDDGLGRTSLPVPIVYDSLLLDTLWVCTNGWVVPGSNPGTSAYSPDSLPGPTVPGVLAPFWTDLIFDNYGTGQGIYVDLQDSLMVIQWANVQRYDNTADTLNFQIQIRPGDSSVAFVYRTALPDSILVSSSVGIQNWTASDAISVEYGGTYHGYAYPVTAGHFIFFRPALSTGVGVAEQPGPLSFSARLLPASQRLLLSLPSPGPVRILLVDISGRIQMDRTQVFAAGQHVLRLPNLRNGIYFLRVETPRRHLNQKTLWIQR
jgi:hypothetical protein